MLVYIIMGYLAVGVCVFFCDDLEWVRGDVRWWHLAMIATCWPIYSVWRWCKL